MPDTWDALIDAALLSPQMDVFGTTVTYVPQNGATLNITGVFDEQFLSLSPLGNGPFQSAEGLGIGAPGAITTAKPVLGVQLSQFATPPLSGDQLSLLTPAGVMASYRVREVQADGHGAAKLTLNLLR